MNTSLFSRALILAVGAVALSGCSNLDETQQRMLSGGAIGAGAGAITTVVTGGCVACGMAIGGAVGTAGGYLVDQMDHDTKSNGSSSSNSSSNGYQGNNGYNNGNYGNGYSNSNTSPGNGYTPPSNTGYSGVNAPSNVYNNGQ